MALLYSKIRLQRPLGEPFEPSGDHQRLGALPCAQAPVKVNTSHFLRKAQVSNFLNFLSEHLIEMLLMQSIHVYGNYG